MSWPLLDYFSVDIQPEMIEESTELMLKHNDRFGLKTSVFRLGDMVEDLLSEADVLFTKDTLIHLSNVLIPRFLARNVLVQPRRFRYVVFVHCAAKRSSIRNFETNGVGARCLDLTAEPFHLPLATIRFPPNIF